MNAALKMMFTLGKTRHLELAALKDARSGYFHSGETHSAFGNGRFVWPIQLRYKAAAELGHLREGMRLAALVNRDNRGSFLHCECVRFEIPFILVGISCLRV